MERDSIEDFILDTSIKYPKAYDNEEEVLKTIKDCYEDNGYVLDTRTPGIKCKMDVCNMDEFVDG